MSVYDFPYLLTDDIIDEYVDVMADQYALTALWSSYDCGASEPSEPLDENYGPEDIALATQTEMRADCRTFAVTCWHDLAAMEPGQAGHDFWLTRNGHGAGFWDRGLGEAGDRLTAMAEAYSAYGLYVGDDGLIHS